MISYLCWNTLVENEEMFLSVFNWKVNEIPITHKKHFVSIG